MASRTRNSIRNIVWGLVNRLIIMGFPFVARTILIYVLGTQYVGLGTLFTSILSVLSLAELGFGTALTFSMYKPAAENDKKQLCALLYFYRRCYTVIGCVILGVAVMLLPFLRNLIEGELPSDINIYVLYAIYVFNTVISYFMYAYKGSVLVAYQRRDISSNINSVMTVIQYLLQIVLILTTRSYYVYVLITPLTAIFTNLCTSIIVDKMYPDIKCVGTLSKEDKELLIKNVKGIMLQKIGAVVLYSVDNIVISSILGLTAVALYGNYHLIIQSLLGIMNIVMSSLIPSVGNGICTESVEKNYLNFKILNFLYNGLVSWCTVCLICLFQPFISLWIGEEYLYPMAIVILFSIQFYTNKWVDICCVYQEGAGLWWENRYVPPIAATINLILNIVLVKKIGVAGIMVATIVSVVLVYNVGYIRILFKQYFKISSREYVIRQGYYLVTTILATGTTYFACNLIRIDGFAGLFIQAILCLIVPPIVFLIFYFKLDEFNKSKELLFRIMNNVMRKVKR